MKPDKKKTDKTSNETFIMKKTPNEIAKPDILKKIEMIENQRKKERTTSDLSKIKICIPGADKNLNVKPLRKTKKKLSKKSFHFF